MSFEYPSNKSTPIPCGQQLDSADKLHSEGGTVILQPIAMRIPNNHGVYSISQLRCTKSVSREEFLARYADHPIGVLVCFDDNSSAATILERAVLVTAYGIGLDCWYIVAPIRSAENGLARE